MLAQLMIRPTPADPNPTTLRRMALADLERVETFPTLSDTTIQLVGMADRENVSVAEVAAVIRRDGVLAAWILRAANTCAYRGRTAVDDVQQAILRMGVPECSRLLCAGGLRRIYDQYSPAIRERCDVLLRHSLFVGQLASGLAKLSDSVAPGPAFTAGLLHDIGRVILCVKCDAATSPPATREDDDTPAHERDAYGIDHCAIGYQFATRNALPENVVRVTLNHHRPEEEHLQCPMVSLVALAERIANHVQWSHNIAGYPLDECPRFEVLSRGWGQKRMDSFRAGLSATAIRALRATRLMLKSCA
jgi:HD-like signal output (HDOD) protein